MSCTLLLIPQRTKILCRVNVCGAGPCERCKECMYCIWHGVSTYICSRCIYYLAGKAFNLIDDVCSVCMNGVYIYLICCSHVFECMVMHSVRIQCCYRVGIFKQVLNVKNRLRFPLLDRSKHCFVDLFHNFALLGKLRHFQTAGVASMSRLCVFIPKIESPI